MKGMRILSCVVLCSLFALSFAGCGGSDIELPPSAQEPGNNNGGNGNDNDNKEPENPTPDNPPQDTEDEVLTMVDPQATPETKALYSNLWALSTRGFMFGHHDDLWYGRYWYNEAGGSDTKAVCGDYTAVFSVDVATFMDNRFDNSSDVAENEIRRRVILEAYSRGEVIVACAHLNNPMTGGDSWDNSSNEVVKAILDESNDVHAKYMEWLDRLADFALNLKADDGTLIPLIFRPYHEHTQGWPWWGSTCATDDEFIAFWKMTVTYLRDTKGVHNFIYAISPQMDEVYADARGRLLYRWPGDEWVDFMGMDCYHYNNIDAFNSNLSAMSSLALSKRKPCGVTETGKESFTDSDYWTRCILTPLSTRRISMVVMWRNKYVSSESDKHFYSVYPGHPSEEDFRTMYSRNRSIFSSDLPDMYTMAEGVTVQ